MPSAPYARALRSPKSRPKRSTLKPRPHPWHPRFAMSASKSITDVLSRDVSYSGEGISVRSLEDSIHQERTVQDSKVSELKGLRERNVEIQTAMGDELK